jgi:UDP-N-acetyl-D-mannosaminuronic acid dehydrogenase
MALDTDVAKVALIKGGEMPFMERGAQDLLPVVLADGSFDATVDPSCLTEADVVVVVVGTPVDEHLNPDPSAVVAVLTELSPWLRHGQLIVLRSTVFPGVTRRVEDWFEENHPGIAVTFCPERIAEGSALTEMTEFPQLVGARTDDAADRAVVFFDTLGVRSIRVSPEEAELAKLFTNSWRYIKFAVANQFWMMANEFNVDFERVRSAIIDDYPRAADMPGAGFAAGPCLLKDTTQLSAFSGNRFTLGNAAITVNEGLPLYLIERLTSRFELAEMTVGILGMAFKGEIDDNRSSLSYKLRKLLSFSAREVLCSDPYVVDDRLVDLDRLLHESDLVIVATPHAVYQSLVIEKPLVDIWNLYGRGVQV